MFERVRHRIATWIAPQRATRGPFQPMPQATAFISDFALNWGRQGVNPAGESVGTRMYHAAKASRLTATLGQASDTSSDEEMRSSLRALRDRSRQLVRDSAYAKRAKTIVVNNVVGAGIGLQAQVMTTRGALNEPLNAAIEEAWDRWSIGANCHTGGALHFADLERAAMGQVFEAGEIFLRKHYSAFGDSEVPLALELVEAERMVDDFASATMPTTSLGAKVRLGVEVDTFGRAVAYWIRRRHPSESRLTGEPDQVERVPADQIIHLRLVDRWPQTRGEPWLHAVIRKLNDMDGYTEAELVAARGAACYLATIQTPDLSTPIGEKDETGNESVTLEPGVVQRLREGEIFNFVTPNRPNNALDPFMRAMLREMAAGAQVSYESLSRDYSQSNYSSSRLALLDDRDLWRMLQLWFIRSFREPLHREWLRFAIYANAVRIPIDQYIDDRRKFEAVRFKPRGWSWIDPTKEVEAYKQAVRNGFTTVSDVIAQTGGGQDIEDVLQQRERELRMMADKALVFDTDPAQVAPAPARGPAPQTEPAQTEIPQPSRIYPFGARQ